GFHHLLSFDRTLIDWHQCREIPKLQSASVRIPAAVYDRSLTRHAARSYQRRPCSELYLDNAPSPPHFPEACTTGRCSAFQNGEYRISENFTRSLLPSASQRFLDDREQKR